MEQSIVTDEAWKIMLQTKPPHRGFMFQPVEYEYHMAIRVFLDNFAEFSDPQREDLAWFVADMINRIRKIGVPCYVEAYETVGGSPLQFKMSEGDSSQ